MTDRTRKGGVRMKGMVLVSRNLQRASMLFLLAIAVSTASLGVMQVLELRAFAALVQELRADRTTAEHVRQSILTRSDEQVRALDAFAREARQVMGVICEHVKAAGGLPCPPQEPAR